MPEETALWFGPFRLDVANERMWRGQEELKLTRKAFAVLHYLVEHAGQLVTKEALFTKVWPEVVVGDAALTVCIRELRQVLGATKAPQYIETVYGRGYRFIGKVISGQSSVVRQAEVASSQCSVVSSRHGGSRFKGRDSPSLRQLSTLFLVGRELELAQLQHADLKR